MSKILSKNRKRLCDRCSPIFSFCKKFQKNTIFKHFSKKNVNCLKKRLKDFKIIGIFLLVSISVSTFFVILVFLPKADAAPINIAAFEPAGLAGSEVTFNATTNDANLNTVILSRGAGINPSALVDSFCSNAFASGGNKANAISTSEYLQLAISPKPNYKVSLSSIDFNIRRSSTGPNAYQWQYSLDGFATGGIDVGAQGSYTGTDTNGLAMPQINLSGVANLQNVVAGTVVTFRLYAWGATNGSGTFAIGRLAGDDLVFKGNVDPLYYVSGTTDLTDGSTIAIALNGVLQPGLTGTVLSGAWTIIGVPIAANDIVTVWNDGATEVNESTAVTKQAGVNGSITGMVLNRHVLSLGSSTNQSLTLSNLGLYDNDNDEDIMHSANAAVLNVDATNSYSNEKIDILFGDTLTIGGTETLNTVDLTINGTLTSGGNSAYNVTGNWTNNGTFTPSTSTTVLNGTSAQNIGGSAGITFNNLTISNTTTGVSASTNTTVNGVLSLSANPSATVGSLNTGAKTLTMGASATTVGAGDVTGIVKRTTLVAGTEYTFGNRYTSVNFRNTGTLPTDLSVKITIGSAPAWKAAAIQRTYEFVRTGGSGSYATLKLHYLDSELNGNTENTLVDWACDTPFAPGTEVEYGRSNYDTTNNFVSSGDYDISLWATSFNQREGTLGNSALSNPTWNGSVSTAWSTPANWTPSGIPSDLSDVVIPDASTTLNAPTLNPTLAVGRLTIDSGGILNAAAGSVVTISGSNGAWSNNGGTFNPSTSEIIFTNANATVSGTTNFYSVTINPAAGLSMTSGGTMRIGGVITNNGTWRAAQLANNTVEYNGAAQTVLNPNGLTAGYDNLILSGTGAKTMPVTTLSILGNFTMSGTATAIAGAVINTTGNFTVGPTNTFTMGAYSDSIGGDFTNNNIFTATGSTITFNGTVAQAIGGTTDPVFNTLNISNTTAPVTATANFSTNGMMTVVSGAEFDTGTNVISGGGGFTLDAGGTLGIGSTAGITSAGATGNIQTATRSFNTGANYIYNGTANQAEGNGLPATINNLTINNPGNTVTLGNSHTVNGILTLTGGNVATGANTLTIAATGSLSGASSSSYVFGNLQKSFNIGAGQSFDFAIGDASYYTPVNITSADVGTAGSLTVKTTAGNHPNIGTSNVKPTKNASRYWTFTAGGGLAMSNYDSTFNFDTNDIIGGANTAIFLVGKFNAGWTYPTVGSKTSNSTQITGQNSFSDFQVGEALNTAPTSTFNSVIQKTNGSGVVDISIEVADVDNDDTKAKMEYETDSDGACDGPWASATLIGPATADNNDSGGAPDVNNINAYQVGSTATTRIITSSGSNTVDFDWDFGTDLPGTNGTQCLRLTVNDNTLDQIVPATQTVILDDVAPTGLTALVAGATTSSTQVLTWTTVTETNFDHYEIWYGTNQTGVQNRVGTAVKWGNLNDSNLANIATATTTITGLLSNSVYYFKIWAVDLVGNEETVSDITTTTLVGGGGGGGGGSYNQPIAPTGGFSVSINSGAASTTIPTVTLNLKGGSDTDRMAISNFSDFRDAPLENYATAETWNLCWESAISKTPSTCPDGTYTVYAKYYTSQGVVSGVVFSSIILKQASQNQEQEQEDENTILEQIDKEGNFTLEQMEKEAAIMAIGDINQILAEMGAGRDLTLEDNYGAIIAKVIEDTEILDQTRDAISYFITYGTPSTKSLGAGERAGVVNSFKSAFGKLPTTKEDWNDVIKITNGRWPNQRSKIAEDRATINFRLVYLRDPDRANSHDDSVVTVMAYGLRPANRNLDSEKAAIKIFRDIFGYAPSTATAWDVVRAIAYSGAKREVKIAACQKSQQKLQVSLFPKISNSVKILMMLNDCRFF